MEFDALRKQIIEVNKAFYERVYKDEWLSQVFAAVRQEHIVNQQSDFMLGALGGPKRYSGRSPFDAHPHIFIDEEMWQLREKYLKEAFQETGLPSELQDRWIRIDEAFKQAILKKDVAACKGRYTTDQIIHIPKPAGKKAA